MKEKLAKLVAVKSIVTLALTLVFSILALTHYISAQEFLTIFTVIISFYFGTQYEKKTTQASNAVCADPANCPLMDKTGEVVDV